MADGVDKGTTPNRAFSDRFPVTVATWLLMVVAVIVWGPSIGFFAYGSIVVHKYVFCEKAAGTDFSREIDGIGDWGSVSRPVGWFSVGTGGKGGGRWGEGPDC